MYALSAKGLLIDKYLGSVLHCRAEVNLCDVNSKLDICITTILWNDGYRKAVFSFNKTIKLPLSC